MAMKVHFDVDLSLKMCPPMKIKGCTFIKRIVIRRDKVTFPLSEQTRVLSVKQSNVSAIRDSLEVNGWEHDSYPPRVIVDPDNSDRFIGLSGFNRNAAMSQLGWETMLVDIYEYSSPLAKRRLKTRSNHHKKPFSANTKEDVIKQVILAIKNNEIPSDEQSIKDLIDDFAEDKTVSERKKIFESVTMRRGGSDTIKTYHTKKGEFSTESIAVELKLPFSGDKHLKLSGELGYINPSSSPKTTLYDAKVLSSEYDGAKVAYISYIEKPSEQPRIYEQRKQFQESFNKFLQKDAEFVHRMLKSFGVEVDIQEVIKRYPIYFKGFLPQVVTPEASKNGNPKEETLVDALGNVLK